MDRVYVDGIGPVSLDPNAKLGSGTFGAVYKHQNLALKVWHTPNQTLADRLSYAASHIGNWSNLSDAVLLPTSLVRKSANGPVIGMTMPLLDTNAREVGLLFRKAYRVDQHITLRDSVNFGVHAFATLCKVHAHNLYVVDINHRNVLYLRVGSKLQSVWIDFDSWYIKDYPIVDSLMYTPAYVDPAIQYASHPTPTNQTDNYSLWVILFRLISGVHPYGGTHPTIDIDEERIKQRIWAYAPEITLPSFALRPEIFSDELMAGMEKLFVHGDYSALTPQLLEHYGQLLVECKVCHEWFPRVRKSCPTCNARNTAALSFEASQISLVSLVTSTGVISFSRFQGGKLISVAYEGAEYALYTREKTGTVARKSLFPYRPSLRFDVLGDSVLAVNVQGSQDIELWDITGHVPRLLEVSSSEVFAPNNNTAVFRATNDMFYRLAGHSLMEGSMRFNQLVDAPTPVPTSKTQTWIWADSNSNCVLGFNQTHEHREFWILLKGVRIDDVAVPQLAVGEALYEMSVRFGKESILVRRRTKLGVIEYLRTDIVSRSGQQIFSSREELSQRRFTEIHHYDYSDHESAYVVWHPTDKGIVAELVERAEFQTLTKTKRVVSSQDRLVHLGSGTHFLVIRESRIDYLTIK
jgi:hypothetical protein